MIQFALSLCTSAFKLAMYMCTRDNTRTAAAQKYSEISAYDSTQSVLLLLQSVVFVSVFTFVFAFAFVFVFVSVFVFVFAR